MLKNIILMSCLVFVSNLHAECSLEMSSGDLLKFNKREINIDSSCLKFTIYFKHEGVMAAKTFGHNVVIVERKNFEKVKSRIDMKLGEEAGYLPDMPEIVAKTGIIGGGAKTSVTIDATKLSSDSEYMFFCSFPGHYGGMQGPVNIMQLLQKKMILIKDDEMNKGYQLVGNVLFCTVIFKDGSIDSENWHPITDMTLYHQDMIKKLKGLASTVNGLNAPLGDDGL